ncbi:F-box-like domain-containing protein [Parachlamydia sp. AcF125]|uniref:F-box-like domain-containing protein n=1 Tax=Parachlamydia sp. AcF125 TaxID=2795736 RepID=UPI001BC92EF0|nr:F-box-like domain-containing protein [Parachlamydia sp. AcF125]MBS4168267.1 hypothetical protein [Parachlamydia sp. AcF125]
MFNYTIREFGEEGKHPVPFENDKEAKVDFTYLLPQEISLKVFSFLNSAQLGRCLRVSTNWKMLANDENLWDTLLSRIAFGKKQWARYFGDVGQVPPLPREIHKVLKNPCPFWPEKKIEETHLLVLIPETLNGKPLTLATLGELVRAPKEGYAIQFKDIWELVIKEYGHQAAPKSQWVLMTKNPIERSEIDQHPLIVPLAKQYELPNVLDAAVCIFIRYISSGERIFNAESRGPYTLQRNDQPRRANSDWKFFS